MEDRFFVEDIPSGQIKTKDLALADWSNGEVLNRPGSLQGMLGLTDQDCNEQILSPWRTAIYRVRDSTVEWGGILVPPTLGVGDAAISVGCFGWLGYWDHRSIRIDRQFSATDQFEIFQTLINDAQDEGEFGPGWDLGITVEWDALSGVLRDALEDYRFFQGKNLGEALRQLAALDDGFDYAMQYEIDASTDRINKTIQLFYPRKGRTTDFLYEYERSTEADPRPPTNVLARGLADPVDFAWVGDGWGSGADATRLVSPYIDEDLRGLYPPYDGAPQFTSVTEQERLDQNTAAWFHLRQRARPTPTFRIDPERYPRWGDWILGDTVRCQVQDGYGSTDPSGQMNRITGWKIAESGATHDIILADPDWEVSG